MKNLLTMSVAAALLCGAAAAQIPGVRLSLSAPSFVVASSEVTLMLAIEVEQDVEVPAQLLSGADLIVRVDGKDGTPVQQPGKGGPVALEKGTRIARSMTFPATMFVKDPAAGEIALVAVAWRDMPGVDCTFKVTPDTENVKLDELDLSKTEVVLVTNYGDMKLAFRPDKAPKHVESFVKLCLQGFYDGTKFHRVIRNFMIQGGCPNTKDDSKKQMWGSGGPGYTLDAEFNDLRHLKGTLSAARTSDPNSAGSGFFVVHRDSPHLDGQYTAFGNLVEGVDTLERIANVPVGGPTKSMPFDPVVLQTAIVLPVRKK